MVNIKLDSNYTIGSDSLQWMLIESGRYVGYFATLEGCIESYFNRKSRQSNAISVSGLLEHQKNVLRQLQRALTPLHIEVTGLNIDKRPNEIKEAKKKATLKRKKDLEGLK
jgi:hypothetical protein